MKRILFFFKRLFGYSNPTINISELVKKEAEQIEEMNTSINEIKVIHEEITTTLENSIKPKRLTKSQIIHLFFSGKELHAEGLTRNEKQYYAKKIFLLKKKRSMKIAYNKTTKSYKYYPNGL